MTLLGQFWANETFFQKSILPIFLFLQFPTLQNYKFSKILIKLLFSYECCRNRHGAKRLATPIAQLCNLSIILGIFPDECKIAKLIP